MRLKMHAGSALLHPELACQGYWVVGVVLSYQAVSMLQGGLPSAASFLLLQFRSLITILLR